ncbi:MAG: hypothetical protein P1U40_03210 [Coxiellaceae bacterium]|nr:hypothetical protein [Coxiellaceae bacterium]
MKHLSFFYSFLVSALLITAASSSVVLAAVATTPALAPHKYAPVNGDVNVPLPSTIATPKTNTDFINSVDNYGKDIQPNSCPAISDTPYMVDGCLALTSPIKSSANYKRVIALALHNFYALSWPAGARGEPDSNGADSFGLNNVPTVWGTYHHRTELYGSYKAVKGAPTGTVFGPTGPIGTPDNPVPLTSKPHYLFSEDAQGNPFTGFPTPKVSNSNSFVRINACSGINTPSSQTPWHDLDENSQIGFVYIGAKTKSNQVSPILFEAKLNNTHYQYIANNYKFWTPIGKVITSGAQAGNEALIKGQKPSAPPLFFPAGSIETKAAWRQLTPEEIQSNAFYSTPVRYYSLKYNDQTKKYDTCYIDSNKDLTPQEKKAIGNEILQGKTTLAKAYAGKNIWGLLGLHIIIRPYFVSNGKKQPYPFFVFSTFEQKDNYQLSPRSDKPAAINTPEITNKPPILPITSEGLAAPLSTPHLAATVGASSCTSNLGNTSLIMSYLQNPPNNLKVNEPVCVVARRSAVSKVAAETPKPYLRVGSSSVWNNYNLIDVQWAPTNPSPDYPNAIKYQKKVPLVQAAYPPVTGPYASSYYLANGVIETPLSLSNFRGLAFLTTGINEQFYNRIADFSITQPYTLGYNVHTFGGGFQYDSPTPNTLVNAGQFNMGGCQGCHGTNQARGGDFSFLLGDLGTIFGPTTVDTVANSFPGFQSIDQMKTGIDDVAVNAKTNAKYQQALAQANAYVRSIRRGFGASNADIAAAKAKRADEVKKKAAEIPKTTSIESKVEHRLKDWFHLGAALLKGA